jgi:hypothetical protein
MEFKGTKGKWEISTDNEEGILITSMHPQNRDIASVWKYDVTFLENEEAKANALLISKSPEILEMLKEFYGVVRIYNENNVLPQYITNEMAKAYKLIKEATEI